MTTFQDFLDSRNIDANELTQELAAALVKQWQSEQPEPVRSLILIPDGCDGDQWQRAIRLGV